MHINTIESLRKIKIEDCKKVIQCIIFKKIEDTDLEKIFKYCLNIKDLYIYSTYEQINKYKDEFANLQKIHSFILGNAQLKNKKENESDNNSENKSDSKINIKNKEESDDMFYESCLISIPNVIINKKNSLIQLFTDCDCDIFNNECDGCLTKVLLFEQNSITNLNIMEINRHSYHLLNNLPNNLERLQIKYYDYELNNLPTSLKKLVLVINCTYDNQRFDNLQIKLPFGCKLQKICKYGCCDYKYKEK
jgi:hypothetical protein